MTTQQNEPVTFRRIGGRIVPIRVSAGKQGVTVSTGTTRGPYKTKRDRRNEQRRERYAIRKELQAKKEQQKKQNKLFGIKALDVGAFSAGVAATVGAFVAFRKGRIGLLGALKKNGMPEAQKNALVSLKNSLNVVRKDKAAVNVKYFRQLKTFDNFIIDQFRPKQEYMFMGKKGKALDAAMEAFRKTPEARKRGTMLARQAHLTEKIAGFDKIANKLRSNPLVQKGYTNRARFKKFKRINDQYGNYFDFAAGTVVGSGVSVAALRGDE